MSIDLRPSAIAGLWYEGDSKRLAKSVDAYLDGAHGEAIDGEVIGVIAPHAGHQYSGSVAGYSFAAVRGRKPDLVVILSPFHNFHPDDFLTTSHEAYTTPLGNVFIDRSLVNALDTALQSELGLSLTRIAKDPEHALEIELPCLQRARQGEWKLLPIMVRSQDPRICQGLGRAIAKLVRGMKVLLVGSTDLSHSQDQKTALAFDRTMLARLEAFDPEGLIDAERAGLRYACGLVALAAVMWAGRDLRAARINLLLYPPSPPLPSYSPPVPSPGPALL